MKKLFFAFLVALCSISTFAWDFEDDVTKWDTVTMTLNDMKLQNSSLYDNVGNCSCASGGKLFLSFGPYGVFYVKSGYVIEGKWTTAVSGFGVAQMANIIAGNYAESTSVGLTISTDRMDRPIKYVALNYVCPNDSGVKVSTDRNLFDIEHSTSDPVNTVGYKTHTVKIYPKLPVYSVPVSATATGWSQRTSNTILKNLANASHVSLGYTAMAIITSITIVYGSQNDDLAFKNAADLVEKGVQSQWLQNELMMARVERTSLANRYERTSSADVNEDGILNSADVVTIYNNIIEGPEAMKGSNILNGHKYVDMGTGRLWATCNIGADLPEGYGDYFAWGETNLSQALGKGIFTSQNYEPCANAKTLGSNMYLKQSDCPHENQYYGQWEGWEMPSVDDYDALLRGSEMAYVKQNGVQGLLLTSKKNGNTLFFPACGYMSNIGNGVGLRGYYWTIGAYSGGQAVSMHFEQSRELKAICNNIERRYYGLPIRLVADPELVK